MHQEKVLSDDLAAAFIDDDDDMLADFQWGSGNKKYPEQNATTATASTLTEITDVNESFSAWLQDENDTNDDYVWGSAAKNARLSSIGSTAKRPKLESSEIKNTEHFSWGSTSELYNKESSLHVKCTGCHQQAKE